ncbi:uncharacterized protein CTRU02_210683 [Colletotrichum truncatum]|uniref:Uncharacterized protein n=1 Tax=Colletotrichum truncatum TaxID=5467 RepID=A0ACC3YPP0_COLTU|nr:uncharacterized protein CTRU02_03824 [Colletotrichum truncatum]KAF6796846.1 hypothetical protein CTRU02_03824 [Colletotrichum truncatum]
MLHRFSRSVFNHRIKNTRRQRKCVTTRSLYNPLWFTTSSSAAVRPDSYVPEWLSDPVGTLLAKAFWGEKLPRGVGGHLPASDDKLRCSIRGIRHHENFARSPEVTQLCSKPENAVFARARNARLIMSNFIPEMISDSVKPYCIWYPDLATEDVYRELALRYPDMRYHVGRACAVAGYTTLYNELDILPDVSIAEEARDNSKSTSIFESIMAQDIKYRVMDDYTRTVHLEHPSAGAFLNCDTAVRSSLEFRTSVNDEYRDEDYHHYFDILEDGNLDLEWCPERLLGSSRIDSKFADLLCSPLPRDLAPINKDILILMAAWDGNIDRYSRLRRPKRVSGEISALMRGALHHTAFARWLDMCMDEDFDEDEIEYLRQAVNARFIMNNDLSRITTFTPGHLLPEIFWYPQWPHRETLRELAWRRTDLRNQCAIACIVANYRDLFDELDVRPSRSQWEAACQSPNSYFRSNIEQRAAAASIDIMVQGMRFTDGFPEETTYNAACIRREKEPSGDARMPESLEYTAKRKPGILYGFEEDVEDEGFFSEHVQRQIASWATYISVTDEAREKLPPGPLYSKLEDIERRKRPAPMPRELFVKSFEDLGGEIETTGNILSVEEQKPAAEKEGLKM